MPDDPSERQQLTLVAPAAVTARLTVTWVPGERQYVLNIQICEGDHGELLLATTHVGRGAHSPKQVGTTSGERLSAALERAVAPFD